MAYVLPDGYPQNFEVVLGEEQTEVVATDGDSKAAKKEIDAWKLNRDLLRSRSEGWEMWKGNVGRGMG
jgi:hypothetical protein